MEVVGISGDGDAAPNPAARRCSAHRRRTCRREPHLDFGAQPHGPALNNPKDIANNRSDFLPMIEAWRFLVTRATVLQWRSRHRWAIGAAPVVEDGEYVGEEAKTGMTSDSNLPMTFCNPPARVLGEARHGRRIHSPSPLGFLLPALPARLVCTVVDAAQEAVWWTGPVHLCPPGGARKRPWRPPSRENRSRLNEPGKQTGLENGPHAAERQARNVKRGASGPAWRWNPHTERLTHGPVVSVTLYEREAVHAAAGPRGRRASGSVLWFEPKAPNKFFFFSSSYFFSFIFCISILNLSANKVQI
jgi:hypothetical protein